MRDRKSVTRHQIKQSSIVGGSILSLVTRGMYANPLAIYREYVQNAADAIEFSGDGIRGRVEIKIDPAKRYVTIRDNGPGLSFARAQRELIPIAKSNKSRQNDRGFRGIGRLSGLAFGDSVTFLTRNTANHPVTQVIWHGEHITDQDGKEISFADDLIARCVTVEKIDGSGYPARFFEVQIFGVFRHVASSILNRDAVRQYLSEVSPIPFEKNFSHKSKLSKMLSESPPMTLEIYVNDDEKPVTRPHKNEVHISENKSNKFTEFEEIRIPMLDGNHDAAVGWIAHSSYHGAISKSHGVRCLRARVGNIQIGDETVFDHLFTESRFNRWCVAEVHVLDSRIVPNGRRDYFEPSIHVRNLENHLGVICRQLEKMCRAESKKRNQQRQFDVLLEKIKSTLDLAWSGYLTTDVARKLTRGKLREIVVFKEKYADFFDAKNMRRLDRAKKQLENFQSSPGRKSFDGVNKKDVATYRNIFKILAETSPSPAEAKITIETILNYTKADNTRSDCDDNVVASSDILDSRY